MTLSQMLVVAGLACEFISVLWTVRRLFYGYEKRIKEMGDTKRKQIERDKKEGAIVLLFLTIGMGLQGLAVFVL